MGSKTVAVRGFTHIPTDWTAGDGRFDDPEGHRVRIGSHGGGLSGSEAADGAVNT